MKDFSYSISASVTIDAAASEIFDILSEPASHADISGDSSVGTVRTGVERIGAVGDRFGVKMRTSWPLRSDGTAWFRFPYRMTNTVIECDKDHRLSWRHVGRHVWSWELEPADDGRTHVTESVDFGPSPFRRLYRLMGYPAAHRANLSVSLENLRALAES